jgi:peptidoglycan/LPS O-acetylase OafA/YrhL
MSQFSTMVLSYGDQAFWATGVLLVGTSTSPVFALLILWAIHSRGGLVRPLSHPLFRVWATLSYGMYLFHIPVIEALGMPLVIEPSYARAPVLAWLAGFVLCVVMTTLVALVMHLAVERPMLLLRDKVAP